MWSNYIVFVEKARVSSYYIFVTKNISFAYDLIGLVSRQIISKKVLLFGLLVLYLLSNCFLESLSKNKEVKEKWIDIILDCDDTILIKRIKTSLWANFWYLVCGIWLLIVWWARDCKSWRTRDRYMFSFTESFLKMRFILIISSCLFRTLYTLLTWSQQPSSNNHVTIFS